MTPIVMALGFKEIFWDSGGIWLLMLAMSLVWLINTLNSLIQTSKKFKGR